MTIPTPVKVLSGHTSPETAYVVDDYPYGFKLRCKIRYWVETKKGHGQRFMSQTTNPKVLGEVWNKPKGSTYSMVIAMCLDEKGHVQHHGLTGYMDRAEFNAYMAAFATAFTQDYEHNTINYYRKILDIRDARNSAKAVPQVA